MPLETPLWRWALFSAIVLILLAFDLGVLNRKHGPISLKRSLWLSAGYIGVALMFAAWVNWQLGADSALAFLTGYAIEKTLALDTAACLRSAVFIASDNTARAGPLPGAGRPTLQPSRRQPSPDASGVRVSY